MKHLSDLSSDNGFIIPLCKAFVLLPLIDNGFKNRCGSSFRQQTDFAKKNRCLKISNNAFTADRCLISVVCFSFSCSDNQGYNQFTVFISLQNMT